MIVHTTFAKDISFNTLEIKDFSGILENGVQGQSSILTYDICEGDIPSLNDNYCLLFFENFVVLAARHD